MDWREAFARAEIVGQPNRRDGASMLAVDTNKPAVIEAEPRRVRRMDIEKRLALVRHQPRQPSGAGHRMPLITETAGVQNHRPLIVDGHGRWPIGRRNKARASVGRSKAATVPE